MEEQTRIETFPEDGYKRYVKKPVRIRAKQIDREFTVQTKEGVMRGKAGDYLIEGVKKELYPCDREIFEQTYYEAME